ncbi:hypothetical protein E0W68_01865 [Flavobacterium salilacus subsp. salilacus]|uniref:hypothetical protein n=1 Tax=Flavobacterium TaxID=237 RepID=UPI0010757B62|nr:MULTISPECIES: hypothetical protein [Flavobacterium]KAF2519998.1 hypothetical protein E0W68_01865 [Flavobacterium salilacus subsp. salilacus]MBE1614088.1 hypothetical protein [Flavobacterium sp. SaA2.13]NDI97825.1 hypothetical protein [Flavobacterium salilacus subsp. altitudinum]
MKKTIVLFVLFALPIVAYLFFASGINTFAKLPIVTPTIKELPEWRSLSGEKIKLKDKITILGFPGEGVLYNKGNAFNLNQKIYNKNKEFTDFQMVMVAPIGTENQAKELLEELGRITDVSGWHFVFASPQEIQEYYGGLQLVGQLDEKHGTPNVFIIDKDLNLRGRKGKNKKGEEEYKEGYNTISAADLHNEMSDDVKIILAEYRLALKKNNKRQI